jgi:type III secretion protein Q
MSAGIFNQPRFNQLRSVTEAELAVESMTRACHRAGIPLAWKRLGTAKACLRFSLHAGSQSMACLIDANEWAAIRMPGVCGFDWSALDKRSGELIFGSAKRPLDFADNTLDYEYGVFQGVEFPVEDSTFPVVPSREGMVLLAGDNVLLPAEPRRMSLPGALALELTMSLGTARLTRRSLDRLRPNDVLLIPQGPFIARISDKQLFLFSIHAEHIIVDHILANDAADESMLADASSPPAVALASLPIDIQVVLCRSRQTLEQLATMVPGTTFPLAADAHLQVELTVNGQTVAQGELVQVGEGLGVQINRTTVS